MTKLCKAYTITSDDTWENVADTLASIRGLTVYIRNQNSKPIRVSPNTGTTAPTNTIDCYCLNQGEMTKSEFIDATNGSIWVYGKKGSNVLIKE